MTEKKNGYTQKDWQQHYDEDDLGWDLGQVAPPFVNLFESKTIFCTSGGQMTLLSCTERRRQGVSPWLAGVQTGAAARG